MNKLTAYKCLECDHITISRYDGIRCAKCGGAVVPIGDATYIDCKKQNGISIDIKLEGYDKVKIQLTDIETRIDRIVQKSKKLSIK